MFSALPLVCCLVVGGGRSEDFCLAVDVPQGKIVRSLGDMAALRTKICGTTSYELTEDKLVASGWPQGQHLWTFSPKTGRIATYVVTGSAVLCDCGKTIYVLDKASGAVTLTIAVPEGFEYWSEALIDPVHVSTHVQPGAHRDGRLFTYWLRKWRLGSLPDPGERLVFRSRGSRPFALTAMSAKTGERLWEKTYSNLPGHPNYYRWPYCNVSGGVLGLWCWPTLWVIDLADGERRQVVSLPNVTLRWCHFDERTLVVATATATGEADKSGRYADTYTLQGIDMASGKRLWQENEMPPATFLGPLDATRIALGTEGTLRVIDPRTGKDQWPPLKLPASGSPINLVVAKQNLAYLATSERLYRIDLGKGTVDWHIPATIQSELVLHPAGLLHCRVVFSRSEGKPATQVSLVRRNPETGAVESETEIHKYLRHHDSVGACLENVDQRLVTIAVNFYTGE